MKLENTNALAAGYEWQIGYQRQRNYCAPGASGTDDPDNCLRFIPLDSSDNPKGFITMSPWLAFDTAEYKTKTTLS